MVTNFGRAEIGAEKKNLDNCLIYRGKKWGARFGRPLAFWKIQTVLEGEQSEGW
jgi:hypothetical protein